MSALVSHLVRESAPGRFSSTACGPSGHEDLSSCRLLPRSAPPNPHNPITIGALASRPAPAKTTGWRHVPALLRGTLVSGRPGGGRKDGGMGSRLPAGQRIRTAVRVEGIVQGVGFRPFVYSLATGLGLGGLVGNDSDGVFAEVEGPPAAVEAFLRSLARDAPPLARIERITTTAMRPDGTASFSIAPSEAGRLGGRWCPRTPRRARTAWPSSRTRPTGGSGTRSSTARTAAPGSRSCATSPTTGR